MEWSSEAIDTLRALWAEGHSTAEIGRRMGVSKNAVVGKAHRLNLSARPSPIRREVDGTKSATPAVRSPAAPRPAAPRPAAPATAAVPPRPVMAAVPAPVAAPAAPPPRPIVQAPMPTAAAVLRPFQRLSGRSCCWPLGEPGTAEFRFCTSEALSGKPYCSEHASVAYVRARDRREDAA